MAEENRTSQGVSLQDKQGLDFRGHQPLPGELFAFKSGGDGAPPARRSPQSLSASGIDLYGLILLHTGTHDLTLMTQMCLDKKEIKYIVLPANLHQMSLACLAG